MSSPPVSPSGRLADWERYEASPDPERALLARMIRARCRNVSEAAELVRCDTSYLFGRMGGRKPLSLRVLRRIARGLGYRVVLDFAPDPDAPAPAPAVDQVPGQEVLTFGEPS